MGAESDGDRTDDPFCPVQSGDPLPRSRDRSGLETVPVSRRDWRHTVCAFSGKIPSECRLKHSHSQKGKSPDFSVEIRR